VWNLFDILYILSDSDNCDPTLLFWLIEELLDSQTISGCRTVFDYLESRREIITANHFNSTKLVILRSCNDLLRRLSRVVDTPFCGRVFIFLFQVFPLGDKSSVNLRGEYHIENITTYDETVGVKVQDPEHMDVDPAHEATKTAASAKNSAKAASVKEAPVMAPDELYPVFWSLQESFSQPKKLFDAEHFAHFKTGLEATLAAFKQIKNDHRAKADKEADEAKRSTKRSRDEADDEAADAYNPKYLTSRDLFELETSDLTFRRHFLVQAIIIMEFLLSLSAKGKEKMATSTGQNKSVMYSDQKLGEEDAKWVMATKREIYEYLRLSSIDGPYFLRMVDTVLARDKNWVRWKIESCPSIELPAVTAELFAEAKEAAHRAYHNKRMRPVPMGSLNLAFLDDDEEAGWAKLMTPDRYALPDLASFKDLIEEENLEIDMPSNEQSKNRAVERKASKTWRALRIAATSRMARFDKIENDNNINAIFEDDNSEEEVKAADPESLPSDTRLIILSGTRGVGTSALINKLMERNPEVFKEMLQHTTSTKEEDKHRYHMLESKAFTVMLDGDKFLENSEVDGIQYGTSSGAVSDIRDAGKVPIIWMSREVSCLTWLSHIWCFLICYAECPIIQRLRRGRTLRLNTSAEPGNPERAAQRSRPLGGCRECHHRRCGSGQGVRRAGWRVRRDRRQR
jgi:THO complex subunit 1